MSISDSNTLTDEQIAGALTELGEDVSVDRVARVKEKLARAALPDASDSEAVKAAVDAARHASDVAHLGHQEQLQSTLERYRAEQIRENFGSPSEFLQMMEHDDARRRAELTHSTAEQCRALGKEEPVRRIEAAGDRVSVPAVDVARNAPDVRAPLARQRHNDALLEKYIKMSAESVASLRKDDVFRVLAGIAKENVDGVTRPELAWFIASARPDLESEVEEVMKEEFPADNWAAAAVGAPDTRFESGQKVIFNSTHSEAIRDGKLNLAAEIVRPLTDEEVDLGEVGPMYVIRFENGQTEQAFEDELSSSDVVKRE